MDIWQWTPFCALIFLAGLSMVPVEIEEAARLETQAAAGTLLRHVQLPYLLPGLTAMLILRSADMLKLFDMVFTMTRGGPGAATELVSIYIQRVGFRVFDLGIASAQAILLLILTIVLARLYIRFFYREIDMMSVADPRRQVAPAAGAGDPGSSAAASSCRVFPVLLDGRDQPEDADRALASPPVWFFTPDARQLRRGAVRDGKCVRA